MKIEKEVAEAHEGRILFSAISPNRDRLITVGEDEWPKYGALLSVCRATGTITNLQEEELGPSFLQYYTIR